MEQQILKRTLLLDTKDHKFNSFKKNFLAIIYFINYSVILIFKIYTIKADSKA